jgi:hypothetical protein
MPLYAAKFSAEYPRAETCEGSVRVVAIYPQPSHHVGGHGGRWPRYGWSLINDAYSLINAGLPASLWAAIGAAIFFGSVIVLLAGWYNANEQREREQPGPAAAIPTNIKLQFRSGTASTVVLQTANIWSWYLFRQRAQKAPSKKGQPPEEYTVATMLFLLFDRPVGWKQILVDGNALPRHEVKNSSRRHAIIHFVGAIPAGTVLEVKAQT